MADQDGRWGLISAGKESPINFFSLQLKEPYNWERGGGGLISGRGGSETAVYGTRRMRVKNLFIYFLFFLGGGGAVSRRLYRFGSWNWKWQNPR